MDEHVTDLRRRGQLSDVAQPWPVLLAFSLDLSELRRLLPLTLYQGFQMVRGCQQATVRVERSLAALPERTGHVLPAGLDVGDSTAAVVGVRREVTLVQASGPAALGQQPAQGQASGSDLAGIDHGSPPRVPPCQTSVTDDRLTCPTW